MGPICVKKGFLWISKVLHKSTAMRPKHIWVPYVVMCAMRTSRNRTPLFMQCFAFCIHPMGELREREKKSNTLPNGSQLCKWRANVMIACAVMHTFSSSHTVPVLNGKYLFLLPPFPSSGVQPPPYSHFLDFQASSLVYHGTYVHRIYHNNVHNVYVNEARFSSLKVYLPKQNLYQMWLQSCGTLIVL